MQVLVRVSKSELFQQKVGYGGELGLKQHSLQGYYVKINTSARICLIYEP
jgi:hypothetical protein